MWHNCCAQVFLRTENISAASQAKTTAPSNVHIFSAKKAEKHGRQQR
jgi:hypothetical protein